MNKIREAMLRAWCKYRNMEYVEGHVRPLPSDNFEQGFLSVFKLPLADRLTAEERETIIKLHIAASSKTSEFNRGYSTALERIFGFGAKLFTEEGGV